jgi:hypothetical protein
VEAAGDLVGGVFSAELAAGVEDGHDDLDRGTAVHRRVVVLDGIDGDAAAVVDDRAGAIGVDGDGDDGGVAGHGLVDGVINDFVDEVVEGVEAGAADVHARALADGVEAFEHLDLISAVLAVHPARVAGGRRGGLGGGIDMDSFGGSFRGRSGFHRHLAWSFAVTRAVRR